MKTTRFVSLAVCVFLILAATIFLWPPSSPKPVPVGPTAPAAAVAQATPAGTPRAAVDAVPGLAQSATQPAQVAPVAPENASLIPEATAPPDEAKLAAFKDWTTRWTQADATERKALREEGVRLARERRNEFKALIATNPRRALEEAVPRVVRQQLPPEIVHHLEKPVSAKGDYNVYLGQPAPGQPKPKEGLALRYFEANDVSYKARVFGEMEQVLTKKDIPLRGVAVDRELAVAENPVRQLEVGEIIPLAATVTQVCPVSGNATTAPTPGTPVTDSTPTVEVGGQIITLCNGSHVHVLEDSYRTQVQASGPGGAGFFYENFPGSTTSSAIGNFRTLYIRVTYPDQMAEPNTEEQAYSDMRDNRRYYLESSYGKMTQTTTVTSLLVLPHTLQWYYAKDGEVDCLGLIHNDSRAAAKAAGYDPSQFTCIIVRINKGPRLEGISWGGGSSVWITWGGMGVLNHECGHSLGRNHANYWSTTDGTAYGTGANQEYGNDFDVMGGGGDNFAAHYNTISKRALGWLPDSYVHLPKLNGVYRIYAYDQPRLEEGKRYALSVAKDSIRSYNLEYHPAYSQHQNSALVLYSGMGSNAGHLLDTTPGSPGGKNDAGILVGRTYSDLEADMHFTVLSKNATIPPSIDVAYNRGPFPGNLPPTLTLAADATTIAVGGTVNFTATANDPNGDPLAYQWEFNDSVDGLSNSSTFSRTFTAAAQVTAMVTVSDMKGGTARASLVINVGAHGKQTITGTVTAGGQPLAGVYLTGGGRYCYSNTDGSYALAGVATGAQTLTAVLNGYTLTPSFTNPLTVVAGTNTANWTAAGSTFVSLTKVADAAEGGANGTFRLTRTGDTSADLVVLVSPAAGTATKTTDYTFAPDYVASGSFKSFTIPAGSATLDVTVAAVNDTAAEGPETITLQLASAAGYLSGSANAAVMTIADNDTTLPEVGVIAPDPYATEAPGDPGSFTFTRTGATTAALNLTVAWSGAATNGTDYTALPTTVTIPIGQSSVSVAVTPINDSAIEPPEDVIATISTNAAYVRDPGATTATVTITDDDTPVVSVSVPDPVASEAGPESGVFLITRTGSTAAALKVYYGLSGSALHGTDYVPLSGEVIIPAGATSAPVVVTPYDDDIAEPAETVTLALATFNDAYSLGTNFQGTLTILDNSDIPLVSVRAGAVGTEGGTNPTVIFHALGSTSGNVTVNYTVSGTATPGSDYTALSGTVSVPANGSNDVTVTIPLINDTTLEPTETVVVTITPSASYRVYNGDSATAFIRDNDSGDRVMVSTYNQSPSESGPTAGTFYLSRTGTTGDLTVNYTMSGTATNGVDYQTLSGTVVIPDTQSGVNLTMTPIDDALGEGTETVTLNVQPGTGYGVDWPASATFEIADNDTAAVTVGFAQAALATSEQPGALGEYRDLLVVLSAASGNTITVNYTAGGGSAAGDDEDWAFVDAANGNAPISGGTLTFAPGVTSQNIRIRVKNDGVTEGMETAILLLRAPFNASLTSGRTQETIAIFDDVIPAVVTEERWNNTAVYTNQSWGSSNADYTGYLLSFTPAQDVADNYSRRLVGQIVAPATGTYNFWIASDDASRLYLSTDSTAANKAQIATLTTYTSFQNWDANASQKSANISLVAGQSYYMEVQHQEGGGGDHVSVAWQGPGFTRTPITFSVTDTAPRSVRMLTSATTRSEADGSEPSLMAILDRPAGATPITVNYTSTGTATNGSDYQLTPGTLTFAAGEQMKAIPLTLLTDAIGEGAENIIVSLSSPSGAQLATPSTHTITLIDASAPTVDTQYATATSGQSAGTLIATAKATPASGRTITGWTIVAGNPGNAFAINASGQVTLALPALLPNPGPVQLVVRATDNAGATGDGAVNIICNAPAQAVVEQRWNDENVFTNESWSSATPSYTGTLATFTSATDIADHYSRRLTGFLKPQTTGDYTLWVAGDDDCRLYFSTDGNPSNKTQVAYVSGWTSFQEWDKYASQKSATITLQAGKVYWLEAQEREGSGGDSLAVAWAGPGISRQAIPTSVLFPCLPGTNFTTPAPIVTAPALTITSPANGSQYGSGANIAISASVTAGSDPITSVDFYRGSTLIGSDATAPYGVTYSNAVIAATETLTARANYGGTFATSPGVNITVWNSDPAVDADGDGYTNGLEVALGTNPYSAASQPATIYSGLRAWWKLDESSGTVADDATGRVQDGTVAGGAAWGSGIVGGALNFDGVDDGVLIGNSASLTGTTDFTLAAWVKVSPGATGTGCILQQREGGSGTNGEYMLNVNTNGTVNFFVYNAAYQFNITTTATINDGQWHYLTALRSGANGLVYFDGVQVGSGSGTAKALGAFAVAIGYDYRDNTSRFKGALDDVRIYSRALSQAEIDTIAPNRAPFFTANPVTKPAATEDAAYSGATLADVAADADYSDTLTFTKVSGPAWLSVAANGALSGTPANGDVGANSFTVRVTDNGGLTSNTTLNISVANTNDAPTFTANPIAGAGATEDAAYASTLAGSATDVDAGDTLTYAKVSGPAWLSVATNGALSGTPDNSNVGANAFTIRVTDAAGANATATLNISVANTNDAPTFAASPITGGGATEDSAYSGTLAGTATDVDAGDTLTYSKVSGPAWLGVASNGALSGTPGNSDVGANAFTVRVTDAAGANATATLNIAVANVNDGPTWTSGTITKPGASEGLPYSASLAADASDIDAGDTLTFSKVGGPAWLSVAPNGALTGTPAAGDAGTNSFTVRVTDAGGLFADATLQITVVLVNTNGTWINPAGGSWTTGASWSANAIASGAGKTADFSTLDLSADTTVTLDGARTLGNLVFGDTAPSHNWSVTTGTGGPLTLDVAAGLPAITVNNQSTTISTVLAGTKGLRKAGAGTLTLGAVNTVTGGFTVDAGLVRLQAGAYNRVIPVASPIIINGGTLETIDVNSLFGNDVTVNATGTLKFSAYHAHPNNLVLAGGAITTSGSGKYNGDDFQLDGSLTVNGTAASTITLGNGFSSKTSPTLTVADVTGDPAADLTISGAGGIHNPDTGTTSFTKAGPGTLVLAGANTYTGTTTVSAGVLRVNGSITASTVTVQTSAALDGTGTLGGSVTVQAGATLAPGAGGIGTLTVNNTLSLAGTTTLEVSKAGATLTADRLAGVTTLTYGGTLVVTNVGPDALAVGNAFPLFGAATYAGSFATLTLPPLPAGLVWDTTRLAVDGSLSVGSLPVAVADTATTPEDVMATISVLANDTDADGDTLAIQSVTQGAHGTVAIAGTNVTYTPAANWNGTDTFSYTLTDNSDGTSTANVTVSVTPGNDAPGFTSNPISKPGATIGVPYSSSLAADAADIDAGDTFTFSKVSGPAWLTVAANGALSGVPSGGTAGTNAFTVRVTDAGGLFGEATLNITVTGSLPGGWTGADIGTVGIAGGASQNGGVYTVSGAGADIWNTADAFQFVSQSLVGNGEIRARVTSQSNTNVWAKAGVMIRDGTSAGAADTLMAVTPGNGFSFISRTTAGAASTSVAGPALNAAPNNWVRITRSGTLFTSYVSANGTTWTQVGTATITMGSTVNVGLAVCSHDITVLSTATFDNVTVTPYPAPWLTADIGTTGLVGRAEYFGTTHTVSGAGVLGGTTDGFRYVYQTLSADGSIVARVSTLQNTGTSAAVGIMMRDTLANNARMGSLTVNGSGAWRWQRRTTAGGSVTTTTSSSGTAPNIWVRLVRSGNSVTASRSTDGITWTAISTVTITMASNCYVGIVVDSGSTTTLNTSSLDNLTVVP